MPTHPQRLAEVFDVGDGRFPGRVRMPTTTLQPFGGARESLLGNLRGDDMRRNTSSRPSCLCCEIMWSWLRRKECGVWEPGIAVEGWYLADCSLKPADLIFCLYNNYFRIHLQGPEIQINTNKTPHLQPFSYKVITMNIKPCKDSGVENVLRGAMKGALESGMVPSQLLAVVMDGNILLTFPPPQWHTF